MSIAYSPTTSAWVNRGNDNIDGKRNQVDRTLHEDGANQFIGGNFFRIYPGWCISALHPGGESRSWQVADHNSAECIAEPGFVAIERISIFQRMARLRWLAREDEDEGSAGNSGAPERMLEFSRKPHQVSL